MIPFRGVKIFRHIAVEYLQKIRNVFLVKGNYVFHALSLLNLIQNKTIKRIDEIKALLLKDIQLEWREKASFNSILLYVVATVFVVYLVFNEIEDLTTWIALFWIVLLFAATNASINSFKRESSTQFLYFYSLCSPQGIIFSKLIYNTLLLMTVGLLSFGLFHFLLGNPIENNLLFLAVMLLGSSAFASTLTLVAAIASKTNNNAALTAILAFPILLPSILTAIKASMYCGLGFDGDEVGNYLLVLALLNLLVYSLSYVLFPYLWRS